MTAKRLRFASAFTLVEVMLATLILSIAVIGASGYRYYAAMDARKAAMQGTAARIALLLCESWRGVNGSATYDPTAHLSDLAIVQSTESEFSMSHSITACAATAGFTPLGVYTVPLNGVNYYVVMSWKDLSSGLRALNVVVAWPLRNRQTTDSTGSDTSWNVYKLFKITTYTST
jgi:Tfp pilus assembly protein PilE